MLAVLCTFLISFFAVKPAYAQGVPLFYQLLSTYHPAAIATPSPVLPLAMSTQVLGVASSTIDDLPSTIPNDLHVGGEGQMVTVAVLGDSMIDTLGPGIPQLANALARYYPTKIFNILNYGYGSSNIEYALYRLGHDYVYQNQHVASLLSQNPEIVILESFAYNNFGNTQAGIDRQWLNLGAITTKIKQQLPDAKILLAATVAPNSLHFADGAPGINLSAFDKVEKTKTIQLYLQNILNFASSQGFPAADVYHLSLVNNEGNPDYINPDDHIHPSSAGGQLFCNTLAKAIFDHNLADSTAL